MGKIKHFDKIHEGLHDAILPQELWDTVQDKLQGKASFDRGMQTQRHKNLLTGLIFDEHTRPYTPVFTSKKARKYRYYCNAALARDKDHPNHLRARFPAHEIEATVEQAVRGALQKLSGEKDGAVLTHILKHHEILPSYELVHSSVKRITVYFDYLEIAFHAEGLDELINQYLNVNINSCADEFVITVPFQKMRGRDGTRIVKAEARDIINMPPEDLKRLVQGIVWRDEHFAGTYIKDIATRENYSDRYVRNQIMASFETLR